MAAKYIRCTQGHVFNCVENEKCPRCGELVGTTDASAEKRKARRPGGDFYTRPLHFIWLVDCSGSMLTANKMSSVNYAIRSVIPEMQQAAEDNPNVQFLMRVISFSNGARWHVEEPVPLAEFVWSDLKAEERAVTDLGAAFGLVTAAVASPPMPERALPPVLVLLTDGQATDDFYGGLGALLDSDGGRKAVRVSVAIGADADIAALGRFCSEGAKPLRAHNVTDIVQYIKWVSTVLVAKRGDASPDLSTPPPADDGPVIW